MTVDAYDRGPSERTVVPSRSAGRSIEPIEAALCAVRAIARVASSAPLAADVAELGETMATRVHRARLAQWAECRGSWRLRIIEHRSTADRAWAVLGGGGDDVVTPAADS